MFFVVVVVGGRPRLRMCRARRKIFRTFSCGASFFGGERCCFGVLFCDLN